MKNRAHAQKLLPIIQAFVDGKAIQYRRLNGGTIDEKNWQITQNLHYIGHDHLEYRIKPATLKYRRYIYRGGFQDRAFVGVMDETDSAVRVAQMTGFVRWIDLEWLEADV